MQDTIADFLKEKKVAIVGASDNKDNFGKFLMVELAKKDYEVFPVNPKYPEVQGKKCVTKVSELPEEVTSVILAVPASLTNEIIDQCIGSHVKRVWIIQGMGRGAYTESAFQKCNANSINVVHGFCPMMIYGEGMHQFHFWLRKTFGKLPEEYLVSHN